MAKNSGKGGWLERVNHQRIELIITEQPFFSMLAVQLEIKDGSKAAVPQFGTMATDGKRLYVWPDFVDELTNAEIRAVILHEIMHVGLDHVGRLKGRDRMLWNMACDYVINKELKDAKYNLPKDALLDQQYDGMSAEEVYNKLLKEQKKQKQQQGQSGAGGNGEGDDPGRSGGVILPEGTPEEVAKHLEDVKIAVQAAINESANKDAGKLPSIIQRAIEMAKPQMDWRAILRRFIDSKCTTDFTWSRPSRNALANGIYLPGTQPDAMSKLVVAIDTSGSVDNELLGKFMGEVSCAVSENAIEQTVVIYADAKVQRTETFGYGEEITANAKGGGGTDFRDTFKHIRKHHPDAQLTIYFTDMLASHYGEPPEHEVIWAIYGQKSIYDQYSGRAGFGEPIHISE